LYRKKEKQDQKIYDDKVIWKAHREGSNLEEPEEALPRSMVELRRRPIAKEDLLSLNGKFGGGLRCGCAIVPYPLIHL